MSTKLPKTLKRPYEAVITFLEALPSGLTYDQLVTKIPSLKVLKKGQPELLLQYLRELDHVDVIDVTRKEKLESPLLRHAMYHDRPINLEPVQSDTVTGEDVVHTTTPGRMAVSLKSILSKTPGSVLGAVTPKYSIDDEEINLEESDEETLKPVVGTETARIASDIVFALRRNPDGLTRTDLNTEVESYRRLKGSRREEVLDFMLKTYRVKESTRFKNEHTSMGATLYTYDYDAFSEDLFDGIYDLPGTRPVQMEILESIADDLLKLITDAGEAGIQSKRVNVVLPGFGSLPHTYRRRITILAERKHGEQFEFFQRPNSKSDYVRLPIHREEVVDTFEIPEELTFDEIVELGEEILSVVKAYHGRVGFHALYEHIDNFGDVDKEERKRVFKFLKDRDGVVLVKTPSGHILEIPGYEAPVEAVVDAQVPAQHTGATTTTANTVKASGLSTEALTSGQLSPEAIRRQMHELALLAETMERRQYDTALRESVKPIHARLQSKFKDMGEALDRQIDVVASIGKELDLLANIMAEIEA